MSSINRAICALVFVVTACRSIQPCPPNQALSPASEDDPQTSMERRVFAFAAYWRQDEQEELSDRERDRYFLSLARDAFDRNVRGKACRWLISSAKVLQDRLKIGLDAGVWYTPDYLEPGEMATLDQIASMQAETVCYRTAPATPPH